MIKETAFLFVTGLMVIYGLVFTFKHSGWPSIAERQNKIIRAIKTGFSGTIFLVGFMLIYFYWTSPKTIFDQWTLANTLGSFICVVIPLLATLIAGSFVQFSAWEKTQFIMANRLRKIINNSTREHKKEE